MTNRFVSQDGFSLLELLLMLAVGFTLVAVISQALLGELSQSRRLAQFLRERAVTERALELMRMELQEAPVVRVMPGVIKRKGCGLAGRTVLLHLDFTPDGVFPDRDVTYSIERRPDSIWRSQVLMRCGPAYGLDGQMSDAGSSSEAWLDAIDVNGILVERRTPDVVIMRLKRIFTGTGAAPLYLQSEILSAGSKVE